MLSEKMKAPDFLLMDEQGNAHALKDYKGKKVVVYFYPKDNTPGCTKQACAFKALYEEFKKIGVVVIGISKDSQKAHQNFIAKYELPFLLLSDPDLEAINAYDVWQEKKMCGKTYMGVVRSTYVIDEEGFIIKVYPKASPDKNASEILAFLNS
ncbi:MAG: thioredoxin-dependent thiol peroxidase [Erysipelotrichia bacterium]|nr:thioredoxin-dependent thiol peroxidase [Erysipelotrichia bacterium]NCC54667.1 thioredoxin-dependent thiol peroxidase [Erysipelotrichia bacterium]